MQTGRQMGRNGKERLGGGGEGPFQGVKFIINLLKYLAPVRVISFQIVPTHVYRFYS